MPVRDDLLYVATGGFVVALSAGEGTERWRVRLPRGMNASPLTLLIRADRLYVGGAGRVWCLSRQDGRLLWENGLPKTGFGAVLMAMEGATGGDGAGALAAEALRRQQAAATAS